MISLVKHRLFSLAQTLLMASVCANVGATGTQQEFNYLVDQAYEQIAQTVPSNNLLSDIGKLEREVARLKNAGQTVEAIALIYKSQNSLIANPESQQAKTLLDDLVANGALLVAEKIAATLGNNNQAQISAGIRLAIAQQYAQQTQWNQTLKLLNKDLINDLLQGDQDKAYLLTGVAQQKLKQHRLAIEQYEKIPPKSPLYATAQLNLATAYLRQEWWTDGHLAIARALDSSANNPEQKNRLYITLGFSQLQFGFYRDARESFRNIAINSHYAPKALLGIGIAALSQKDYMGALNAFNRLNLDVATQHKTPESKLLYAFTLQKMERYEEAVTGYKQAIDSYSSHLQQITSEQQAATSRTTHEAEPSLYVSLKHQHSLMQALEKAKAPISRTSRWSSLKKQLEQQIYSEQQGWLAKQKQLMASYLSQSKYGLASIYDSDLK